MYFRLAILSFFLFCRCAFGGFDVAALFNPENFKATDSVWRNSDGKIAAEVCFDSMGLEKSAKVFGVSVPKGLVIGNLKLTVRLVNIGEPELDDISSMPWIPLAADKIRLTLEGKKISVDFVADRAVLLSDKSVGLYGNVRMSSSGKIKSLGESVKLSLRGRMIFVKGSPKTFALKF